MTEQSLDDIMSGRDVPVSDTTTAEPELTAEEQRARDERGRFAAKQEAETQPIPGEVAQPQHPSGHVPIQALDSERGKRKELEERYEKDMREMRDQISRLSVPSKPIEEPKPKPALWDDPEAFMQHQLSPVEERIRNMNERYSERLAAKEYGPETVQSAKSWIEQRATTPDGQRLIQELMQSDDPYDDLVKHYKQQTVISEVGTDPEAFKKKVIEEYLASQAQSQQPQQTTQPAASPMPTAFAKTPSSGPRGGPEYGGPRPLSEIMGGR